VVTFLPGLVEVFVDGSGNLTVTDSGGQSNDITVTLDSKRREYVVASPTADLTANGTTATNTVRIARALVTGGLVADLSGGDDRLKFDKLSLNSTVMGGAGKDTVLAGSGRDQLFGEGDNDSLVGNSGNDRLDGGAGDDIVSGLNGNDTLTGGTGTDKVLGGSGTDLWDEFSNAANVTVTARNILGLGATPFDLEALSSDINLLRLTGGTGDNLFDASTAGRPITMLGGAGNDTLLGGSKHDVISGETGNDLLNGNAGNDTILGGDNNDLILGGAGNDVIDGGADNDVIFGENGNDAIQGGAGNDVLHGNSGNDTLLGGGNDDALFGDSGKDLLLGEAGVDSVDGGPEKDRVARGGNNNPTVPGDQAVDPIAQINELLTFNFNALLAGLDI
ncbi:MAG: hypothetical protein IAG10_00165, partial [Planctomycetaceae bacterium]|nr:hypothetical protein [Planctomycetaceae bacterium]